MLFYLTNFQAIFAERDRPPRERCKEWKSRVRQRQNFPNISALVSIGFPDWFWLVQPHWSCPRLWDWQRSCRHFSNCKHFRWTAFGNPVGLHDSWHIRPVQTMRHILQDINWLFRKTKYPADEEHHSNDHIVVLHFVSISNIPTFQHMLVNSSNDSMLPN